MKYFFDLRKTLIKFVQRKIDNMKNKSLTNTLRTMKKVRFPLFSKIILSALVLSSCGGLKKMQDQKNLVKYEVTPKVLEMQNGEVALSITGKYPAKYFNKKAIMTVTPVLKYAGGETAFKPVVIQGEQVKANNPVIKYAEGGTLPAYSDKITYKDDMFRSDLVVRAQVYIAGKEDKKLDLGEIKIGDGVIATSKLVLINPKAILLADKFERVTPTSAQAEIMYLINRYEIRPSELKKEDLKKLNEYFKKAEKNPRLKIKGLKVSAFASPDGAFTLNDKLSGNREKSAEKFIKEELKKDKLKEADSANFLSLLKTPEDWDGFKSLMEASNIKDKELVLRVLSMYSDPEVRDKEIKNIAQAWTEIKEQILPKLRRAQYIVNADKIGYSDEELVTMATTIPDSLNLEELLYAAKLMKELDKKAAVYKKAADKFPTDYRAKNNLGYIYVQMNNLADAKTSFEAAKAIKDDDVVKNNLGVVALLQNDVASAEELFTASLGAGDVVNYNLGIINITKGKYDAAIANYGNACEFNAGLAKLLNKQYEPALTTLGCVKEDNANVYYLKAIIGARTDNTDVLFNNLRAAVGKDASLKENAKKNVEFLKYFENDTFKSIVQ